jgi:hypothetical protein
MRKFGASAIEGIDFRDLVFVGPLESLLFDRAQWPTPEEAEEQFPESPAVFELIAKEAGLQPASYEASVFYAMLKLTLAKHWKIHSPAHIAECKERYRLISARAHTLSKARADFKEAASNLLAIIREIDSAYGKRIRCGRIGPRTIDKKLFDLIIWADEPPPIAKRHPAMGAFFAPWLPPTALQRVPKSRRGRPPGKGQTKPELKALAIDLMEDARCVSGKLLSFDKNYPEKSSLWRALELLRNELPKGYVPVAPPSRVLAAALSALKLAIAEADGGKSLEQKFS